MFPLISMSPNFATCYTVNFYFYILVTQKESEKGENFSKEFYNY